MAATVLEFQDPDTHVIYYYVRIDNEFYATANNRLEKRTQNGGISFDTYAISNVYVEEQGYRMTLQKTIQGEEDALETIDLIGDSAVLQGFQQKINSYYVSQDTESKGNLRF